MTTRATMAMIAKATTPLVSAAELAPDALGPIGDRKLRTSTAMRNLST